MKKIIRNLIILVAITIVIIIASCTQSYNISKPVSLPPPAPSSKPYRICAENEISSNCKSLGPTATGADRGYQEEQKELP